MSDSERQLLENDIADQQQIVDAANVNLASASALETEIANAQEILTKGSA